MAFEVEILVELAMPNGARVQGRARGGAVVELLPAGARPARRPALSADAPASVESWAWVGVDLDPPLIRVRMNRGMRRESAEGLPVIVYAVEGERRLELGRTHLSSRAPAELELPGPSPEVVRILLGESTRLLAVIDEDRVLRRIDEFPGEPPVRWVRFNLSDQARTGLRQIEGSTGR